MRGFVGRVATVCCCRFHEHVSLQWDVADRHRRRHRTRGVAPGPARPFLSPGTSGKRCFLRRGAATAKQGGECAGRWAGVLAHSRCSAASLPSPSSAFLFPTASHRRCLNAQLFEINPHDGGSHVLWRLARAGHTSGSQSHVYVPCAGRGMSQAAQPVPEGHALSVPGVM